MDDDVVADLHGSGDRVSSWVATREEQLERQQHARRVVGLELVNVRYVDIDYRRHEFAPQHTGWRTISADAEWTNPIWRLSGFDSIDYGVELAFAGDRTFSVSWDSPGSHEGIGIREVGLAGYAVAEDADIAVWSVASRSSWSQYIGNTVRDVMMHYTAWLGEKSGFWVSENLTHF
ncbi:hypothetical protein [Fodinicola acaciae]|uniref:hypothetical protein n=1 Tax=Fodinicola acaciae TaxID=2681555 RepID=UPI0013D41720|nr:hypothetical protein [Fodinicola acaciae]